MEQNKDDSMKSDEKRRERSGLFFYDGDEPKPGLARDPGGRLQSRNVPFGTSGNCVRKFTELPLFFAKKGLKSTMKWFTMVSSGRKW